MKKAYTSLSDYELEVRRQMRTLNEVRMTVVMAGVGCLTIAAMIFNVVSDNIEHNKINDLNTFTEVNVQKYKSEITSFDTPPINSHNFKPFR